MSKLSFKLTNDQKSSLSQINKDLASKSKMFRLLQGDVGCGKTIVALISALNVIESGYQVAFMAPTEILARQHYNLAKNLYSNKIKLEILTGKTDYYEKKRINKEINSKTVNIIFGTHSLFQKKINFNNLGYIIIDEQHKFGVRQRKLLSDKGGTNCDVLLMSATPIPRTLIMSVYGDMDISIIKEKPNHRKEIITYSKLENKIDDVIKFVKKELKNDNQVFWVCPLIDESKKIDHQSTIKKFEYLLSRYEKKSKNYEKEMDYLEKGHQYFFDSKNEKFKLGIKYCFDDVLQISKGVRVEKLIKKNDSEIKPIFIIGVPRCGSTLVEKIIASGTEFIPIGEETAVLENFVNAKILEKQSLNIGDVVNVRNELSDIYKRKGLIVKKYNYKFTDKSLNNFFYLELIKDVYPNAKIINCKRDILSSVMSIFQNNITELAWAHNLDNIFKYFNNYFEIIENYNKIYPDFIYQLKFEDLVNNPEEESKKLMVFCELSWDKKCLEFYKREDLISKTASNIQIREGIYKHAAVKYAPYKKFLSKYGEKYSWFN